LFSSACYVHLRDLHSFPTRRSSDLAGPRGGDAPESVDDSDHGAEKTDERGRGADRGKESETTLQLNQRFGNRVPECARDELERRSEEHTSELQSPCNLVCRLLLEKK